VTDLAAYSDCLTSICSREHCILPSRLHTSFVIPGSALKFILPISVSAPVRLHQVALHAICPKWFCIGSFFLYTSKILLKYFLTAICQRYSTILLSHCQHPSTSLSKFEHCLATLYFWFCYNGIALNGHKYGAITFGTRQKLQLILHLLASAFQAPMSHYPITMKALESPSRATSLLAAISQQSVSLLSITSELYNISGNPRLMTWLRLSQLRSFSLALIMQTHSSMASLYLTYRSSKFVGSPPTHVFKRFAFQNSIGHQPSSYQL